jgi:hypothetical protein
VFYGLVSYEFNYCVFIAAVEFFVDFFVWLIGVA